VPSSSFLRQWAAAAAGIGLILVASGCIGWARPASNVGLTTATLNATVSCDGTAGQTPPKGSPCVAWFKYWPEGNPGAAITTQPTSPPRTSPLTNAPLTANISGLQPHTSYRYQVCGYGDENVPPPGLCTGVYGDPGVSQQFRTATAPASAEYARWTAYQQNGSPLDFLPIGAHWTGGDNGNSVRLPDGRLAWIFADPYLYPLAANGRVPCEPRSGDEAHSALVLDSSGTLGPTVADDTGGVIRSLIPDPPEPDAYFPQGMTVETNPSGAQELRILVGRANEVNFHPSEFGVAIFSLSPGQNPQFDRYQKIGDTTERFWGSGILDWVDGYTYIYGWSGGFNQRSYVARAPNGNVLGNWQFWDGSGWSNDEADAAKLSNPAGDPIPAQAASKPIWRAGRLVMLSVNGDSYLTGHHDPGGAPRGEIQAWTAPFPWGPWSGPTNIYAPPEAQENDAAIYSLAAHPEISTEPLLISYAANYGPCSGTPATRQADGYRPRYVLVSAP
jgi:hypothetical protein